jgi:hypothetical protein
MSDPQLDHINAEIDAIRKDPRYLALKNKKRSAQDAERFNVYLRQLQRLEAQRQERLAGHDVGGDSGAGKNFGDAPTFMSVKPAFRNQPAKIAYRNQTEGHVTKNWTRNAVALMASHPKTDDVQDQPVEEPTEIYSLPVVGHTEASGGRLAVHRLLRRKKRTPAEMERFKERAREKLVQDSRGSIPSVLPREHVEIVEQEFRSTTRKTAPPNTRKNQDSSDDESYDNVADEFNQYLETAEKKVEKK